MIVRLLCLFLLSCSPAFAFVFEGRVVRVKDGDSILVERQDVKRVSEVRLAGIDAPELGQPWGLQSRSALRKLVQGRTVRVEVTDRDRYNRLVGKVHVGPIYVNAAMTRSGDAWAFARYLPDREIRAGHDEARAAGRGLWRLPAKDRVPPATWRTRNPRSE
jgi:endonuclease YncB( thermonuclease family)